MATVPLRLEVTGSEDRTTWRWFVLFVTLGAAWRIIRYLRCPPYWVDEGYQNISVLHKDFGQLLREPLEYSQVAPLGYMWIQRAAYELFGGNEYSLRLWSIIMGVGALLLLAKFALSELPLRMATIGVGIFASSYRIARHAAEAKPYATDGFVAILLFWLCVRQARRPSLRNGLALIAAGVVGVWLSYPAIFVGGAIAVVLMACEVGAFLGRNSPGAPPPRRGGPLTWALFSLLVPASFAAHYLIYVGRQSQRAAGSWLEEWWSGAFPPTDSVWSFLVWLAETHASRMFGYPIGGEKFGSILTAVAFFAGLFWLWRTRRRLMFDLYLVAALLTFIAAALRKYPYGGASRLSQHLAPLICLGAGAGAIYLFDRLRSGRSRLETVARYILLVILLAWLVRDAISPSRSPAEDEHVRPVMQQIAAQVGRDARIGIFNPTEGWAGRQNGPRFDAVARIYLELDRGAPPVWLQEQPWPADLRWILAYRRKESGPTPELVRQRAAQELFHVKHASHFELSKHNVTELTLYEVERR